VTHPSAEDTYLLVDPPLFACVCAICDDEIPALPEIELSGEFLFLSSLLYII